MNLKYFPLISIITATYNADKYLERTILSVLSQNYTNIEYIIIDGKSTDNTLSIINKYKSKISKVICESDKGIYDAWNKGLKIAKGEWIAFLGADDVYKSDAIYNYVAFLNKNLVGKPDYLSSKVQLINNNQKLQIIGKPWNWGKFRLYMTVAHVGSLHSRLFFEKYGIYNLDYKIIGDYEMILRAKGNLKALYLDAITVNMEIGGVSSNNINSVWETHRAVMKTGSTGILEGYIWLLKRIMHWYYLSLKNYLR
jgi:glycosyltransferase involved in cell wall biosynthesis